MANLAGKRIVLGVTGGIAAYKACELTSTLVKAGAVVDVVMTPAATEFVRPLTFQALTGRPVSLEMFSLLKETEIGHVSLAERADLVLIAPLTANTLAKLAHGLADNLLTATVLATRAPLLLAPAMNVGMWENPATRENLRTLEARGALVVPPGIGRLACGTVGQGRLADLPAILEGIHRALTPQDLKGKRVVVTAGGTREALDPVRFLGNRSSGKMGYAIARSLLRHGAQVTLISGPSALTPPPGAELLLVESTREMGDALKDALPADALVMAAAVADYRPEQVCAQKLKKEKGTPILSLVENPDLLKETQGDFLRIGFAAESEALLENARAKLERKKLDLIVANDITRPDSGFDRDTNRVVLLDENSSETLPTLPKEEVAERLVGRLVSMLEARS
ncbi:MAG: bifunctional phosphopantothenoylcysteine decarboxylase/phosphopantothenate--cysteine ligase CoaBC [Bacteroidota bacterium]